jgi:hypothetical protein
VGISTPPRPDELERSIDEQALFPSSQSLDELDALIKEARRRARIRRLIYVTVAGLIVALGVGLYFVFGGGGGGAASHARNGRSQPSGQALKAQQNGRTLSVPVSERNLFIVNAKTGAIDENFPDTEVVSYGAVAALVSDGSGGWYIGGSFSHVGKVSRDGIAR